MIMNNKQKNITAQYSFLQLSYWTGFACISAFSSVYLLNLGVSNSVIGLSLSLGTLAAAIMQPYVGLLVDYNPKITTKRILFITSVLILVLSMLLFPVSKAVTSVVPLMYGTIIFLLHLAQPFSNAMGMEGINAGYTLHYGPSRAAGSFGYATVSLVLGKIAALKGGNVVPVFIAVSFFVTIMALVIYPVKSQPKNEELDRSNIHNAQRPKVTDFFKKYKALGIVIGGLIFIYLSHVIINVFALQIVISKGGTSENMGLATAISAFLELIPMLIFPFLMKRFRVSFLLKLSAIFFFLKNLGTLLAPNIPVFYCVQGCQLIGWGVMTVSIVYFVNDLVDEKDTAQGQAYAGMTLTVGNVVAGMIGGRVIDSFGINTLVIMGVLFALIGAVIFWTGINVAKK